VSTLVLTPAAPRRVARLTRLLGSCATWLLFGFAATWTAFLVAPPLVGRHSLAILSGSMTPTFRVGDLVIEEPIAPTRIRIGDVVTFRDPDNPGRLLTHRVVHYRVHLGRVDVVTRGDANVTVERWSIPANGTVGRVEFHLPKAGYVLKHGGGRISRVAFVLVPIVLLALYELWRIWAPKERRRA
jgi:signal peptidase I